MGTIQMSQPKYVKHEAISLRNHPSINERWVQEIIAEDPSILGLGDIVLKEKERIQPGAGRLDLLFQDQDENIRYEVEIQLGKTDERHIIRTIEYWDIERRRFPQYDHVAVIVAEDITSRFLNVINLFNGVIPLIAIQLNAIKVGDQISLVFTTVLDRRVIGLEDEEEAQEATNREYWEKRGTKATVQLADELLELARRCDNRLELKYNKFYIGLARDGQPFNFVVFRPQKNAIRLELKLKRSVELEEQLNSAGLEVLEYSTRNGRYKIRLSKDVIKKNSELLLSLMEQAYTNFGGTIED